MYYTPSPYVNYFWLPAPGFPLQASALTSNPPAWPPRRDEPLQHSFSCWYNRFMTLMEITYELQSRLQPEQLRALGSFANTYGLRRFRVDEDANRLSFEYDASRLKETEVEHVLRQAKIPVLRRVEPIGTISRV